LLIERASFRKEHARPCDVTVSTQVGHPKIIVVVWAKKMHVDVELDLLLIYF